MQFKNIGHKYFVRLEKGEQMVQELTNFCKSHEIQFATLSAIGAVSQITLGWYELSTKTYHWQDFSGNLEVVSLSGNISQVDNQPFLHIHLVISNETFEAFGGHLKEARVGGTLEIEIEKLNAIVERQFDDETGLKLLDLQQEH